MIFFFNKLRQVSLLTQEGHRAPFVDVGYIQAATQWVSRALLQKIKRGTATRLFLFILHHSDNVFAYFTTRLKGYHHRL